MAEPTRKRNVRIVSPATVFDRKTRAVIVEFSPANPFMLTFRLKGCRQSYDLPVEACFHIALSKHVEAARREKKAMRKQRRQ